ncbi:fluoride efflux transporter FluC [Aestuariibius insulae]|uniref:fluoride efflux transporter FluC n=1 Tax=Aestuariibius insulae TaxID=2058287 RepID=UPI00345E5EE4
MGSAFLQVAIGGAIGSVLRYGVSIAMGISPGGFPLAVLTVNIFGSVLMGLFIGLAASRGLMGISPFVQTGLLGGFTTFSAFSLEAVTLYERGAIGQAALYVGLSVGLSIAGLFLGLVMARGLFS